jgi:transaldolase
MELVEQIVTIYGNYGYETEVIVASIRNPVHVLDAALMGADIATMPYKVMEQLISHPLTEIGLERFLADWRKMEKP